MKRKNLADVLLKVLGFSMCIYAIPGIFSDIPMIIQPLWYASTSSSTMNTVTHQAITNALLFGVREVIEIVIGILVIVKSRKIAEFWFKNEEE